MIKEITGGDMMSLGEIKGQDRVIKILKNSIKNNHIAHAYLFVGQDGIGKKTTALSLAGAINCLNPLDEDLCGNCLSCKKLKSGNHPDIELIEAEGSSIKINQIRELRNKVIYMSYESKFKVIIINEADLMTLESANSLLKVLEEPPKNTIFILVTSKPQQLPDTILSRCQKIHFMPLDSEIIVQIIGEKHPELSDKIKVFAKLACGSVKKAEEIIGEGEIKVLREDVINFLRQINDTSLSSILLWCNQWDKDRGAVKTILEILQFWYRDLLIWQTTEEEKLIINIDYLQYLQQNVEDLNKIYLVLELIQRSFLDIEANVNSRLVLEVLLLKIKTI